MFTISRYHPSRIAAVTDMGRWTGTGIIHNWFAQHRGRGAAVPFEAPALRMARVCDDERDGLIAILRDFANNGAAYIVPWTSLPLMAPMNDHDLALHDAVAETKATTPAQVRAVVSKLALSGALGPEAKARECERTEAERSRLADVELILILHLLDSCGANLATLLADPVRWRDREAKSAVAAAAAAVGVKRREIYGRIGEFAKLLEPVGLIPTQGAMQSGWLRVLHDEIEAFGESMTVASRSHPSEITEYVAVIARTAKRIAELSGIVLGMLDYAVLDIGGTIRRWNSEMPVLRQSVERLSLMLDEWPSLMKLGHDALRGPAGESIGQLRGLCSVLPRLPDTGPRSEAHTPDGNVGTQSVAGVLAEKLSAIRSMLGGSCAVAA